VKTSKGQGIGRNKKLSQQERRERDCNREKAAKFHKPVFGGHNSRKEGWRIEVEKRLYPKDKCMHSYEDIRRVHRQQKRRKRV